MSDKQKPDLNKTIGIAVFAAAFAALTYPIIKLVGIHDLLVRLSIYYADALFQLFKIQP